MQKLIVFDTETTNTMDDPFVYDIGWAVIDLDGNVYETASFVNADVFLDDSSAKKAAKNMVVHFHKDSVKCT